LDDVPVEQICAFEKRFHDYLKSQSVLKMLQEKKEITPEIEEELKKIIADIKKM
jgi:F0F1-type ATP synthase alpha subunit